MRAEHLELIMRISAVTWAVLAVALSACGGEDGSDRNDRRQELLTGLADTVIVPTLADIAEAVAELSPAVSSLCEEPSNAERLAAAREAWRAVRRPWKRSEAFWFGPVSDSRIDGSVDFWPVRIADIEEIVTGSETITAEYVASLGASRKGLPALEYLLFAVSDNLGVERTCDYAVALAADVATNVLRLQDAWLPRGGDFRGALATAAGGNDVYRNVTEATQDVGDALFGLLQRMEDAKLATPAGFRNGGIPVPERAESRFSDNALADLEENLDGVSSVYGGTLGVSTAEVSFSSLVEGFDRGLDADVRAAIERCKQSIQAVPPPLSSAVSDSPAEVAAAFECVKELRTLFLADVAGPLGITPTFGDNDGD